MDTKEWAEHEIELACKMEEEHAEKPGDELYGTMCYRSALELFNKLCDQGHSGLSASITQQILNRLIDLKPLTPLEDTPESWQYCFTSEDGKMKSYQHIRCSSLFKHVYDDGVVEYRNSDRVVYRENGEKAFFHTRMPDDLKDFIPKITFPYMPEDKPYVVIVKTWLTDRRNGDFDTRAFMSIETPDGECIPISFYYGEVDGEWQKITESEYCYRVLAHKEREKRERESANKK